MGANSVPTAVPSFWWYYSPLYSKLLFPKSTLRRSVIYEFSGRLFGPLWTVKLYKLVRCFGVLLGLQETA